MTSAPPATPMLDVRDLHAYYGESHVLHGVSLTVGAGEVIALLGRNGAGKTTTLRSIIGILGQRQGSIKLSGRELIGMESHEIARLGVGYCPEERGIFASLTVEENLHLPPVIASGGMSQSEIYELFPNLMERRRSYGTKLSGGEQQMLAVGRLLRTGAKLLLLDEPTEGLAPVLVNQIGQVVDNLKQRGLTDPAGRAERKVRFVARRSPIHRRGRHRGRRDRQGGLRREPRQAGSTSRDLVVAPTASRSGA